MTEQRGLDGIPRALGGWDAPNDQGRVLRALLSQDEPIVLPGAMDALTARLVERAGFDVCYVSGAGLANSQFGLPDVGLISQTEVVAHAGRIADAVAIPVVVDIDTGYGGPLAVMRTVHMMRRIGVAGVQIEDQAMPKRCGHFGGRKNLVSSSEMVSKIVAAKRAARDSEMVVIARTDARQTMGFDEAIDRGRRFRDAGADVVFIEAPASLDELRAIPELITEVPLVINVVEGGLTPQMSAAEYAKLGYSLVLNANFLMRVAARATMTALAKLRDAGDTRGMEEIMLGWDDRQEIVQLEVSEQLEDRLIAYGLQADDDA